MSVYKFTVEGPLYSHRCSVSQRTLKDGTRAGGAFDPDVRSFRQAVRLYANIAGVPSRLPRYANAGIYVKVFWKEEIRLDVEDVGKLILDGIFGKANGGDRRVLEVHYIGEENTGKEEALVTIEIP